MNSRSCRKPVGVTSALASDTPPALFNGKMFSSVTTAIAFTSGGARIEPCSPGEFAPGERGHDSDSSSASERRPAEASVSDRDTSFRRACTGTGGRARAARSGRRGRRGRRGDDSVGQPGQSGGDLAGQESLLALVKVDLGGEGREERVGERR